MFDFLVATLTTQRVAFFVFWVRIIGMNIYIGADHRGFKMKEYLKTFLKSQGYNVTDLGNDKYDEGDDYPDFAIAVAEHVAKEYEGSRGILICGSGAGMSITANKLSRIRAVLALTPDQAFDSRNDDDANVLALAANYVDLETGKRIVGTWLTTPFSGEERHQRRIGKIRTLEIREEEKDGDS